MNGGPMYLRSGWAGRFVELKAGLQAVDLLIPGDSLGLDSRPSHPNEVVRTLTSVELVRVASVANAVTQGRLPDLNKALARASAEEDLRRVNQIIRLGPLDAYKRLAHLLCELIDRFQLTGDADNDTIDLPLTQMGLAQATGLSSVHVNRVVQTMRREQDIVWEKGRLKVLRLEHMQALAEFVPMSARSH